VVKRILVSAAGSAAALALIFGASANANPYDRFAGQTYAKVQQATNGKLTIASRVGEYLPTEECIVTGSRRRTGSGGNTLLVDLNCNDTYAGNSGHSGNSAATPEGQKAMALRDKGTQISENFAKGTVNGLAPVCERYSDYCAKTCQKAGNCSDELLEYLGL